MGGYGLLLLLLSGSGIASSYNSPFIPEHLVLIYSLAQIFKPSYLESPSYLFQFSLLAPYPKNA